MPDPSDPAPSARATLAALPNGAKATILRVGCARPVAVRLLEMGLVPGTAVEVRRRAPLGDPIELGVRGYSLSVRQADAAHVEVEPSPQAGR